MKIIPLMCWSHSSHPHQQYTHSTSCSLIMLVLVLLSLSLSSWSPELISFTPLPNLFP